MELREKYEKENGHNVYAYRQDYAGARPYQDGFNDEYVEWLESKVKNLSLCAVSQQRELLQCFCKLANITHDTVNRDIEEAIYRFNAL